jgi:fructose-bisphosphate aldolase class II
MSDSTARFQPGVVTGQTVSDIFRHANENNYALPAVNVVGSDSINGVLEAAAAVNSPVQMEEVFSMPVKVCQTPIR